MPSIFNPTGQPLDHSQILSARSGKARPEVDLISEKIKDHLLSGARALSSNSTAVQRAKVALVYLNDIAGEIGTKYSPDSIGKYWNRNGFMDECADAVSTFRMAFGLHREAIQSFRESMPDLAFQYLLYRELFHGRLPVLASDLKETLANFVDSKPYDTLSLKEQRIARGYRGVPEALNEVLRCGPVFIVTGDTFDTVLNQFAIPNGWLRLDGDKLLSGCSHAPNLVLLPKTGMEIVRYDNQGACFVRENLVRGILPEELPLVQQIVTEVLIDLKSGEHFVQQGRRYQHDPKWPPGSMEARPSKDGSDFSLACFPAGKLKGEAREEFKRDIKNAEFLEDIVCEVNQRLEAAGMSHILAKRGGLSTVDLVTSNKGVALSRVREKFLHNNEVLVFLGDHIALSGNDVEAISVAEVSIQVGHEWDTHLYPPGSRTLLRSKRIAAEGGAAEFIACLAKIRRLGMTGLLAPEERASIKLSTAALNSSARVAAVVPSLKLYDLNSLVQDIYRCSDLLLDEDLPLNERPALATDLTALLKNISPNASELNDRPFAQLEIFLLKRAVAGRVPVLASDIKDTMTVFDTGGFEWFKGAYETFVRALRTGPFYLITGDSLPNVRDRFLIPSGMFEPVESYMQCKLPGIQNFNLITRTGLDRVTFNFATGQFDRTPLVPGVSVKDEAAIIDILDRTTERFKCREEFAAYRFDPKRPPGYIETRGREFGSDAISFAYFPAGVLLKEERARFRAEMMDRPIFHRMTGFIRSELQDLGLDSVIAQQGGISTIDLSTATKGTALAEVKKRLLDPREYFVYIGDTITQNGNDGSMVGVAEVTVQVASEQDKTLSPPPNYLHIHSPFSAREYGTAVVMEMATRARKIVEMGFWT